MKLKKQIVVLDIPLADSASDDGVSGWDWNSLPDLALHGVEVIAAGPVRDVDVASAGGSEVDPETEDAALGVLHALRAKFDWSGTEFMHSDIEEMIRTQPSERLLVPTDGQVSAAGC